MGQRYSFHFRIFENKGGKNNFFQIKSKKKKKVLNFIPRGFPCGDFFTIIWLPPPIRTLVRVFERQNWLSLGGGGEFAVEQSEQMSKNLLGIQHQGYHYRCPLPPKFGNNKEGICTEFFLGDGTPAYNSFSLKIEISDFLYGNKTNNIQILSTDSTRGGGGRYMLWYVVVDLRFKY